MKFTGRRGRKIGTIEDEKRKCLAAFKRAGKYKYVLHCHHSDGVEKDKPDMDDDYKAIPGHTYRIRYIATAKAACERAIRFNLYRPITDPQAVKELKSAFKREQNWDIFSGKNSPTEKWFQKWHKKLCGCKCKCLGNDSIMANRVRSKS